jgi:hypothetical protein
VALGGSCRQALETLRADGDGGDGFIADIEILRGNLGVATGHDARPHLDAELLDV